MNIEQLLKIIQAERDAAENTMQNLKRAALRAEGGLVTLDRIIRGIQEIEEDDQEYAREERDFGGDP